MSALSSTGITPVEPSQLPASVRNGTPQDQKAYETALGFEQMLLTELSTELAKTASMSGSDDGSGDGSGGSDGSGADGSSDGLMGGSDPASTMYSQLLPQALTDGVMSAGGTGMALQLMAALDPTFGSKK